MTSSRDLRRALIGVAALAAVAGTGIAFVRAAPSQAQAGDARALVLQSLAALDGGNASRARALARRAVAASEDWGLAHAVLARAALAEGDGVGAEAELGRARDAGFDMARVRQLWGHARLLQGDADGALREVDVAAPAYRGYAARIRARALAAKGDPAAAAMLLEGETLRAPRDADAWTDLARLRRDVGDAVGAIDAATRAVSLDPAHVDALLIRAGLVRTQFGLAAALPWYEAALKRDPWHHDALIDYAATLGDVGRTVDMLAAARTALAVRPGSPQALYLMSVLAARAGNTDLARGLLQRTGGALEGVPGALLLGATLDLDAGGTEQAVTKLRNLIAIQPMNIRARQLLGQALLRTGAASEALDILGPLASRGDADSYTLLLVARAHEATGRRDLAAAYLDRAAVPARDASDSFSADDTIPVLAAAAQGLDAGEPSTAVPLIRALIDAGDQGGALARAEAVARANPGSAAAATVLGDTLMTLGRIDAAASEYRRAAGIAFDEPTMLRLVEALDRAGRRDEAARALALFLSQNPANVAALRLAAHWQVAAGEYDAAIAALEELRARLGNRDAALLAELAYAYGGAGEADRAASYAAAAYALSPSNPAAADAYGWSLFNAGDQDGALQLLQKAVAIAPRHATLRWHLGQLYAEIGRVREARFHIAAALADPRFGERAAAERLVASLG